MGDKIESFFYICIDYISRFTAKKKTPNKSVSNLIIENRMFSLGENQIVWLNKVI